MNNEADKYDDPELEAEWLQKQKDQIEAYLIKEGIEHGAIAEKPDWFVAPYVSIWRIAGYNKPQTTGWWAISGDLPTDYCSSIDINDARSAMYHFAKIWDEVSECMIQGKPHPDITIGNEGDWPELGDLLKRRSMILSDWVKDDELWD